METECFPSVYPSYLGFSTFWVLILSVHITLHFGTISASKCGDSLDIRNSL